MAFIENLTFSSEDPVALAVKRYFDKKYNLDIATNVCWMHLLIGESTIQLHEECSNRKAKDIIFLHFKDRVHFELLNPKHPVFEGFKSRPASEGDDDDIARSNKNDRSWALFHDSATGRRFRNSMIDFDSRLDALLSKRPKISTRSKNPEASTKAQIKLPWFTADGALGAGFVDTNSEESTADHLGRVYCARFFPGAMSGGTGSLAKEPDRTGSSVRTGKHGDRPSRSLGISAAQRHLILFGT